MIVAKVVGIFIIVFIGFGAARIGWISVSANKYLASIVINIAAPCMVIVALSEEELSPEKLRSVLVMFFISAVGVCGSWAISLLFNRFAKVPHGERGVFSSALMFTNFAFIGYPIVFSIFGSQGLFLLVMIGVLPGVIVFIAGMTNMKQDAAVISGVPRQIMTISGVIKEVLIPPVIGTIVALAVYFFQIPIPEAVSGVMSSVGSMMTPLAMIVIGVQLTESNPKEIIKNKHIFLAVIMRLIVIPVVFFLILNLFNMPVMWLAVATLYFLLPAAAIISPLASQYGANEQRAAELVFMTTLFSMITVPIASVLLHSL